MSAFIENWMTQHADLALFVADDLRIKLAVEPWELDQYFKLRKAVFSDEQGLLAQDKDVKDLSSIAIVAIANSFGMADQVIGAVRIYQTQAGIWFGGRLCVKPIYRHHHYVGKALVSKAVSTAIERGCQHFYATVQASNEHYFQRLHWQTLRQIELANTPHCLMEAQLDHYPLTWQELNYRKPQE